MKLGVGAESSEEEKGNEGFHGSRVLLCSHWEKVPPPSASAEDLRAPSTQRTQTQNNKDSPPRPTWGFYRAKGDTFAAAEAFETDTGGRKATALSSPEVDFSAHLQLESSVVLPSSVSEVVPMASEAEPESERCLYTQKLREVEEANEMLRLTNDLVDRENLHLKQVSGKSTEGHTRPLSATQSPVLN